MLVKILPFVGWLKGYKFDDLRVDALAGLTVALVLIPQSMAYAQLAGLPAHYGLYASFIPPLLAALFGSSRQLQTGPVAVVSLMTSASLEPLATAGTEGYIAYAILLALLVGAFQLSLGVLKLGLVVNFLSHPVVNGFTNAAAIIIASSQLSKMFGVYVDKAAHHYETIIRVTQAAFYYTHWPTLFMGIFAFAIMYGLKRIGPKLPNVLVAVVLTTLISWATSFEHNTFVDIAAIRSSQTQELIKEFNKRVDALPQLSEKKTAINMTIEEAESNGNHILVLDAKHAAAVISIKMKKLKHEIHQFRTKIRTTFFEGLEASDGKMTFYPTEQFPQEATGDGRTWRIKVGNKSFTEEKILMMGGGAVVGAVPKGLPSLSVPKIDLKVMLHLLPFAAIIALLGFMEAISIAKAMAAKTGQKLDPNQELIGQGLANIIGGIGKSYPVSGSFSRSAVNLQAGAISGLSSVFTSFAVVISLLFFTPLFYHLPQAVLAAVIMMAVIGLVNVSGFIHAWRVQWYDGVISIVTFACTLFFAPHLDKGIMVGVGLSLMVFLYKSMRPVVTSLSMHKDNALRSSMAFGLKECAYVDVVRFDGPLFFANSSYLEDQITERMMKKKELKHIILVADGMNDIDASGEEVLSLIVDRVKSAGIDISFSGVNESVMAVFKRTHLLEKIGHDHIYSNKEDAIMAVHEDAHQNGEKEQCPLKVVCHLT